MNILIYECPEAPPNVRFCARYLKNGVLLPAVTFRSTRAEIETAAEAFRASGASIPRGTKTVKPRVKSSPPHSVQTVKPDVNTVSDFEDLL